MALSFATGEFALNGSTGNQAVTGVGFTPTLLIFIGSLGTPDASGQFLLHCIGAAESTSKRWAIAIRDDDLVGTSAAGSRHDNGNCIIFCDNAGGAYIEADLVTFDADGFTINIGLRGSGTRSVHYIAMAGADLSGIDVGTFNMSGSTGNQAVTGVGFQPDCVLFANCLDGTTAGAKDDATLAFGVGISSTSRWAVNYQIEDNVGTSDTQRNMATDKAFSRTDNTLTISDDFDFVSQDSDGFTVNVTTTAASKTIAYVALKGPQFYASTLNQPGSTGNQAITGVGFQPEGVIFCTNGATSTGASGTARFAMGVGVSSTERGCVYGYSKDASATTDSQYANYTTKVLRHGSTTAFSEADFVSQDSDGFTINWTTADANARINPYLAIGPAAAGGLGIPIAAYHLNHNVGSNL